MSENNYINHISEAAYKNVVKNKSHTDNNLAWYEEPETVYPKVEAKSIWLDSEHIPEDPRLVSFRGDIYYKTINGSRVAIVEKFDKKQLIKIGDRAVFKSPYLVDCIQNEKYHLTITDANGDIIPFGLKKWTIDGGVGYLSFTDGLPNYTQPFYISGYHYIGRKLPEHMITTDGSQTMLPGYTPTENQSVATKSYVDVKFKTLDVNVEKIIPPAPPTFEGKNLTFLCDRKFGGYDIISREWFGNIVLPDYEWTIEIPEFYNPGYGRVSLLVNIGNSWTEFAFIELRENNSVSQGIIIDFEGDPYIDTLSARGFHISIKSHFTSSFNGLSDIFKSHTKPIRFKARWQYQDKEHYTNELIVCEELEQDPFNCLDRKSMVLGSSDMKYRHVSGIITPLANSHIELSGVHHNVVKKFLPNESHLYGKVDALDLSYDSAGFIKDATMYGPDIEIKQSLLIPENYYNENLVIKAQTFDFFSNLNGELSNTYKFRVDTISDESDRVKSGVEKNDKIIGGGLKWNASEDLRDNNELQLLGGFYVWPEIDFSVNGQDNLSNGTWNDISWLRTGLDYSKCKKTGTRFVTFKYDMKIANGIFISIKDGYNLSQDKSTFAYNVDSMYIKVDGQTDWLNAKEPYDGIGINNEWMQGCLAVQKSKEDLIYCTFGPKPIEGTLYVRIGIKYASHIKFSGIDIRENI